MTRFTLPSQFMPYSSPGRHGFQDEILAHFRHGAPGSILIVQAPTGAGKTRAVIEAAREVGGLDERVLVMTPTNLLAGEVESHLAAGGVPAARWTAASLLRPGPDRVEQMHHHTGAKRALVTNPDTLHIFTQHDDLNPALVRNEFVRRRIERVRPFDFAAKNVGLHVFDEYHAYEERILASVLLYLLKCRRLTDARHKYVFLSATPDPALPRLLDALGFKPRVIEQPVSAVPEGRRVRGALEVEVTNRSIHESVDALRADGPRTLVIFNSAIEAYKAIQRLRRRRIAEAGDGEEGYVEITGRRRGDSRPQLPTDKARILIATSKAELGVNLENIERLIMEPGWNTGQFWQRLGRVARGRDARATIHFEQLPDAAVREICGPGDEELRTQVAGILPTPATHHATVLRFIGYYAASYRNNSRRPFATPGGSRDLVTLGDLPETSRKAALLIEKMIRAAPEDISSGKRRGDPAYFDANECLDRVLRSLRGLRGSGLTLRADFPDDDPGEFRDDALRVLSRTVHEWDEERQLYLLRGFRDTPADVTLLYDAPGSLVQLHVPKGRIDPKASERLAEGYRAAIASRYRRVPPYWADFIQWIKDVPPDQWLPQGVEADDIFV